MDRFDLAGQIFGHGGAVGLVLSVEGVAEGGAAGVEDTGAVLCGDFAAQSAQHGNHAVEGTCRVAGLIAQVGECMKRTIQVG